MENYIYFSDGDGADATGDAGCWPASNFIGATCLSTTTTGHHVQTVAKAMAKLLNAHPHGGGKRLVAVDLTNSVKAEGLSGITGVAITIDS